MSIRIEYLDKSNKALVVENEATNEYILFSYDTQICVVKYGKIIRVTKFWNYSRTTLKHLNLFLRNYGNTNNQYNNKKDFEKRMKERGLI